VKTVIVLITVFMAVVGLASIFKVPENSEDKVSNDELLTLLCGVCLLIVGEMILMFKVIGLIREMLNPKVTITLTPKKQKVWRRR
jgi:hypothetical protein